MKFVFCTTVALSSAATAFQFGTVSLRRNVRPTTSTRRPWPLHEKPESQVEAEREVRTEQEEVAEQEPVMREMDVALSDLSPSEDEDELSRDEHFMRLAIELAEEE